jgi:integrase
LYESGIGVEKIALAMGHSDIKTTLIYVHTSEETLRAVMDQATRKSSSDARESSRIVPITLAKVG